MEFWALSVLTMGLVIMEPGFGQRGDIDFGEWLKAEEALIKKLEDKVKYVERCQGDVEALEARLNTTVGDLERQRAEVDGLNKENEGTRFMG